MTLQDRPAAARYKLTGADYALLAQAGTFADLRTELVDGDVLLMSPQYRPHAMAKLMILRAMDAALTRIGSPLVAVPEVTLDLGEHDQPSPDLTLTTEPSGEGAVPLASVALVVEVSVSTLDFDLRHKAPLYATAGIAEYWVVDVNGRMIHQLWRPANDAYAERRSISFGESLVSATISSLVLATDTL